MSNTKALGVTPDRQPIHLAEYRNSWGWAASIWKRLLRHNGLDERWFNNDQGLNQLWRSIDELPEWQQAPLVLTFDTGVIPWQAFAWAADQLDEFERRLPAPEGHANHVPAVAELLRSRPETPFIGVWATSVTENPFDPWDDDADAEEVHLSGIPLRQMYLLGRHWELVPEYETALKAEVDR